MLLQGKKALILGVANEKSIAYGIAKIFKGQGASVALNYPNEAIQRRVVRAEEALEADFIFKLDVTDDSDLVRAANLVQRNWDQVDILVHSIAFADRTDLSGRFIDTSREGFKLALDVSSYSLVAVCKAFEEILSEEASVMTMSYLGAERVVSNYNVMGIAKAALEACVRYLAVDLGERRVRINAISSGPIKTLAASGIEGMRELLRVISFKSPLQRNVTQEDVARTALYLASGLSSGVTGEIIYVDSGFNILGV
jgi:enoyl-[acyl-carrier protein] reductase I